jgi:hypothetical protein
VVGETVVVEEVLTVVVVVVGAAFVKNYFKFNLIGK